MNNQERIYAAEAAVQGHRDATLDHDANAEEVLIDILTNLRHWADDNDMDFTKMVRMSKNHQAAEANESN